MFNFNPTPFDVRLVAFRIPIRVHPTFWIMMAFLGWDADRPDLTFIWVVCGFFSVLVHELGHALTSAMFGWSSLIVLYFGGGLAISDRNQNSSPWKNILVSLMGPGAGFLFLAFVIAVQIVLRMNHIWDSDYRNEILRDLVVMNFFYGVFNLIPVLPLDGGHVSLSMFEILRLRDPLRAALVLGAIVSGAAAYFFFHYMREQFAGMLMIMLCIQSVMGLQSRR